MLLGKASGRSVALPAARALSLAVLVLLACAASLVSDETVDEAFVCGGATAPVARVTLFP